jgi:hypothetical protein
MCCNGRNGCNGWSSWSGNSAAPVGERNGGTFTEYIPVTVSFRMEPGVNRLTDTAAFNAARTEGFGGCGCGCSCGC